MSPREASSADAGANANANASDASRAARTGGANLVAYLAHAMSPILHGTLANVFGAAVYGLYASAIGILDVVTRLATCGAEIGLLRYVAMHRSAGEHRDEDSALGTALRVGFVLGALLGVLVAVFAEPLAALYDKPAVADVLRLLAPAVPFAACTVIVVAATLAVQVARMNLYIRGLCEPGLLLVFALIAAGFAKSVTALAVAHLVGAVCTCAAAALAFRSVFGKGRLARALRAPRHRALVGFSIPMAAAEVLGLVMQRADLLILLYYEGEKAVGIYAGAEFIARAIANARYAFDYVACPVLAESHKGGDRVRLAYNLRLMTRWVTLLAVPIFGAFVAFRGEVLGVFGDEFPAGAAAFTVLCFGHFANAVLGLTGWVVAMAGRMRLVVINAVIGAVINVGLNLWLVPEHGILGAATAAVVSLLLFRGIEVLEARWLEGVHAFSIALLRGLVAGAAALGVALCLRHFFEPLHTAGVFLLGAGQLVIYVALLIALGLAPEERGLFAKVPGLGFLGRRRGGR